MQQVLLGSASLWEIFLTVKVCLEKQIMRCSLPRKRFTTLPFGEVNYLCIYAVDLAKGVFNKFIEETLSALRWLKTSKATYALVARVSRVTRRTPWTRSKVKSGCNVWQILWLTIVWEFPNLNEYEHIFCRRLLLSHFRSVRKGKTTLT